MPKVEISTNSVSIKLDATETSITELGKQALDLLTEASKLDSQRDDTAPAFGFSNERRDTPMQGHGSQWHQPRTTS